MTIALLWLELAAAAAIILLASQFLAKSADIIAEKTGLGHSFIGVVLLATATSLPELGTGVSSVTFVGEPDLAAGDAFGSNLFNLLIIGLLDISWRNRPILTAVSSTAILIAALGTSVIVVAGIGIFVHSATPGLSGWYVSPVSVALFVVFLGAMYLIFYHSRLESSGNDIAEDAQQYAGASLVRASLLYLVAAAAIVGAAVALAFIGARLAEEMGWEASFVGTQFLALSTSLPELATSYAALRLGAPELAITNVLGSNLFNMGIVLFLDDVAFTEGPLWESISEVHSVTVLMAVFMTSVVMVGLLARPRGRLSRFVTLDAIAIIGLYVAASLLVFYLA